MKLNRYLNEEQDIDDDIDEVVKFLKRDSKKWIKEIQGYGTVYRGFTNFSNAKPVVKSDMGNSTSRVMMYEHKVRKDREPRYVPDELHDIMGKYSKKKFGWNIRKEGLFTASRRIADRFREGSGSTRAIFPIGDYKYVCMTKGKDLNDLYGLYDDASYGENEITDMNKQVMALMDKYKTKGVHQAVQMQGASWECIIKADKYYSVDDTYMNEIMNRLY